MKNRTRKMLTTGTALALSAIFLLSGCGSDAGTSKDGDGKDPVKEEENNSDANGENSNELEAVNLSWLLRIPEQADGKEVLEAVNEILAKDINATLDIQFIDPVAYPEKTKLKISSEEKFDLMFTASGYSFYEYASKGAFVPLEDLLPEYAPKTMELIPESFWDAVTVNGHIYAVPNYQIAARQTAASVRKDMVEKYNFDMSSIKTVEDMEPILATLKENEDAQYVLVAPALAYFDTMNYLGLECITTEATPGAIKKDADGYTVINQFEDEGFVKLVHTLKDFEEKGYINKDGALVEDWTELNKNGETLSGVLGDYKPGKEAEDFARNGHESVFTTLTEPYITTSSILGTLTAVSRTSENPERAVMLIEDVNNNPELYNTLVYGIEGKHYNKVEENCIETIADSGYATNVPWMIGNTFNGYLVGDTDETIYEQTQELNENAAASRILGFSFNPEKVQSEIAQCKTITDEYLKGLQWGLYDDVDATLKEMNDNLRASGMDTIIAEMQSQLDAWVEANK